MPIYEYECGQCNHHLEALQKLSEEPLIYCPECGEATLRKQVSAVAFRLKGAGWYETDFKNQEKGSNKDPKTSDKSQVSDSKDSGQETQGAAPDTGSGSKADKSTADTTADTKGTNDSKAKTKTGAKGPAKSKSGASTSSE
ncbi:MAG: FmdB family transcriptional regulator [Acidiferrobacteraceae bacterium]|nr:FmdB family transcriptional regulator [Acidiferrobacteraceae bacterium]|tara:strand:- start:450 stop:872 length:423 start_codon:yes stop_codon:yes gene_type:complete